MGIRADKSKFPYNASQAQTGLFSLFFVCCLFVFKKKKCVYGREIYYKSLCGWSSSLGSQQGKRVTTWLSFTGHTWDSLSSFFWPYTGTIKWLSKHIHFLDVFISKMEFHLEKLNRYLYNIFFGNETWTTFITTYNKVLTLHYKMTIRYHS